MSCPTKQFIQPLLLRPSVPTLKGSPPGNMHSFPVSCPLIPATGAFPSEDIAAQTRQSLLNLKAIIEANGMTMADVVKTTRATGRHQRVRCHERSVRRIFCRALSGPRSLSGSSTSKECKGRDRSRRRQTLTDRFDERQPNGALHPRCVLSNRQNNRFIIVLGSGFFPTPVFV